MDELFINEFEPTAKGMGYLSLYKRKTGGKQEGCAIYFNQSKIACITSTELEFSKQCSHETVYDKHDGLLKDNVAIVAEFEYIGEGDCRQRVAVAVVHLWWHPEQEDIRLHQVSTVLHSLEKYHRLDAGMPIIFCGDFNASKATSVYKLLATNSVEYVALSLALG